MASPDRAKKIARTARDQQASRGDATGEQAGRDPTASRSDLYGQHSGHNAQARGGGLAREPAQQDQQHSGSGSTQPGTIRTTVAIRIHPGQRQVAPGPERSESQMGRCGLPKRDAGSAGARKSSPALGAQMSRSAMTQEAPGSSEGRLGTPRSSRGGKTSGRREGREHKHKGEVAPRFRNVANESRIAPVSSTVGQRIDLSCSPIPGRRNKLGSELVDSAQKLKWIRVESLVHCGLSPEDVDSLQNIVTRYNEEVAEPKNWPTMKSYYLASYPQNEWQAEQGSYRE